MKRSLMALATSLFAFGIANPALSATIFSETTDVGDQIIPISTAQAISSFNSGDVLAGSLTSDTFNADLFSINLTAGSTFTATVGDPFLDTQLFLFDASGKGLTGNDNSSNVLFNASFTYTPTGSGIYYLAISGASFSPQDSNGNLIFNSPVTGPFSVTSNGVLTSWAEQDGFDPIFGDYEITLSLAAVSAVPEPSVLPGLIGLAGGLGLVVLKRKRLA
jgi:hypothetical protein